MSPEEVELLQYAGQVILANLSVTITQSILYGLYLAIFAFGVRALMKRHPWTKYTWILFGFVSTLFLLFTAILATQASVTVGKIRGVLIDNPELPLIERFALLNTDAIRLGIAEIWLGSGGGGGFLLSFADSVVVWRACVLWPGNTMAKVLPLALLFTSFASAIVSAALASISFAQGGVVPTSSPTGVMLTLTLSLSLATNIVATSLIGYKAYRHRQMMKTSMGSSRTGVVLLFLSESGVAFCILQAIGLGTATPNDSNPFSPLEYTAGIWREITLFAAVAYPVLVLIIVDNHRSISDHTGFSAGDSGVAQSPDGGSFGIESHISFAVRAPGKSSSGGTRVGADSTVGSRGDLSVSADHSKEGSVRFQDLEKGEVLHGVEPTRDP